ncbi:hypothetical protein RI129_012717 [Pyrocoelia pectoralis]|uniref:CRAL-TRIO domain-containing protein n=1 Tax=Pyrocoelia pectoralis TaxID=417401 RepID=A0AAN7ZCC7_9COLE
MEVKFGFAASDLILQGRVSADNIRLVKIWLASVENLPQLTDEQIALFLISTCHNVQVTQSTIQSYFQVKESTSEIFSNRQLKGDLEKMLKVGYYCVLPKRTEDNCAVIVIKLQDTDCHNFHFKEHLKLILMLLDSVSYNNPPDGLISILDLEGLAAAFARYVQEAMPLKMKSVHLFNGGIVLKAIFSIFRPFLNSTVREMIHFQSTRSDMEMFYTKWLSREYLPEEYGGELPSIRVHHDETMRKLNLLQNYFEAEELQRTVRQNNTM